MFGGAERIAAAMAKLFPDAEFWTILGRTDTAERMGVSDRFRSVLPERRWLLHNYRSLAPLYPALVRAKRLPRADLLITSSYAFAHGFRTKNRAPQLCYCYSPLRFAWSMTEEYSARVPGGRAGSAALKVMAAGIRRADRSAASRVTSYVAESHYVARQIAANYGREAAVIWPPVDCDRFTPSEKAGHDGFYLFSSRMIEPYKRPTLAVDAFRGINKRLVMVGDGPELARLRRSAPANVEFTGHLSDDELVPLMQRAAAVVFPSQDDFGLVPVEAMACGRPVIAFAGGGAMETVVPGVTGELFRSADVASLQKLLDAFDPDAYDSGAVRAHALKWRRARFERELRAAAAATVAP